LTRQDLGFFFGKGRLADIVTSEGGDLVWLHKNSNFQHRLINGDFLANKVSECHLAEIVKMFCVFEYRLENVFSDRRFLEVTKKYLKKILT